MPPWHRPPCRQRLHDGKTSRRILAAVACALVGTGALNIGPFHAVAIAVDDALDTDLSSVLRAADKYLIR